MGLELNTICWDASIKGTRVQEGKTAWTIFSVGGAFELFSCLDGVSVNGTKIVAPLAVFTGMLIWRSASATDGTNDTSEGVKLCAIAGAEKATNTVISDTERIRTPTPAANYIAQRVPSCEGAAESRLRQYPPKALAGCRCWCFPNPLVNRDKKSVGERIEATLPYARGVRV